ncbi:MAG TPA: ion transporter [Bacteroidia bacterium]|jgi:voltage-gated potassium channel|nr:ion transporter [Bacteroidia bacterium]
MTRKFKHEVFAMLDADDHHNMPSRVFNIFLIAIISLNVLAVSLETVEGFYTLHKNVFYGFEVFSVVVFTIEYILRVWSVTASDNVKYAHPLWGRVRFMFTFSSLIDLLAFLPFYLPMFIGYDLRFIRVLRLLRLVRILKISRYMHATNMISAVFKAKREELVISLMLIVFLMIMVSSIMFYVEHDAQPTVFASIPETMWWSISTLTTSGYSGMYPLTAMGKTLASVISILGIGLVALPAGIFASGFSEEMKKLHDTHETHEKKYCPYCGKEQ